MLGFGFRVLGFGFRVVRYIAGSRFRIACTKPVNPIRPINKTYILSSPVTIFKGYKEEPRKDP